MKKILIFLLILVSQQALSGGGTSPAAASSAPITLPFYDASDATATDNVNTPAGSAAFASYTTGYDWFYYFCATSSGSIATTIKYTTSSGGVSPSISVWNGVPGAGGTLVNYITSPGDNTVDGILTCEATVVSGQCYYIMIDNWPTPNGFSYGISIYQSPINAACTNIGFESLNKSGWTGSTGDVYAGISTSPYPYYIPTAFSTTTNQHTLYTTGNDPLVGAALPRVCPGQGTTSLRLGDGNSAGGFGATIEQRFSVDNSNALFTYYYAVVFQDNGHDPWEQPVFKVEVLDCSGNPIICGDYLVVANAGAAGFTKIPGTSDQYYKTWTPVFLDLTAYIGSCVTVRFTTNDCTLGGHYGYAYIDASCQPLVISGATSICLGSSTTLTAPSGGASYSWKVQGNPAVVGTGQSLTVTPLVNTTYQCTITSVAGCQSSLIQPVVVNPLPTITGNTNGCIGSTTQLTGSATPDATTPWTSSAPAIATINSSGLITGISAGTTTITYKNSNGCSKTHSFTVTAAPTITGTLSSCIGQTSQLSGTATADATTPWTSSNTAVATISSTGLVSAVSTGTSTITYLNSNGCTFTATYTVNPNPTISGTLTSCLPGTSQLSGSATANATTPWASGTLATATISSTGLVTAVGIGSSTLTYKNTNGCTITATFNVVATPIITNPGAQTACDSYTLPTIAGSNLSGNQKYYNNSQALSGTVITGPITSTQTVWIYDINGTCSDEESFVVTINKTPIITNPGAQTVCDSYTLPSINGTNLTGNQKYYNNSQALSGTQISGAITTTQTVWIYDAMGSCKDEESFLVTLNHTPTLTNPGAQTVCDSYTLPAISGSNLTGGQKYYNNSQALGGTQISGTLTSTQTVWIYDAQGTCKDEESFLVTVNQTPIITNPGVQTVCDSYTLPAISGTNLTGNQKYYNNSQALGGTVITGPITTTQTVWIYDAEGTCSDQESFLVTINNSPVITSNPGGLSICSSYTLPTITGTNLTGNQKYYNNSQALGGTVITGPIVSTQTIWIYDNNAGCKDEESFLVTINTTPPSITNPGPQTVCNSYTLPTITGTNLTGSQKYYNNSQALSGTQITGSLTTNQIIWIYDAQGTCSDEVSFSLTVHLSPTITNPGAQTVCDSYTLPVITGTNLSGNQKYYNNSQALGGTVITGPLSSTQTVWIYDINGICSDEESFLVTVNHTPSITNPGAKTVCDTYTLPTITGTNLSGNQKFYNNSQALSGTQITGPITSTQTVWIYDEQGACKDEESFLVTILLTPSITNPGPQTVCDSYPLPTITGTNLSGGQKYYNNSQASSGTQISGAITSTQTVWIYDIQGTCPNEKSFLVTVNNTPSITNPGAQTVCDSYTLPTITGTNLTGNEKFFNNSQALGGTQISGTITTTQTVWIYDTEGSCSDEESFLVTINQTPVITNPGTQTVCDSYTLPTITGTNLTGTEKYFSNSQALSGSQITGAITSTQTVWIFDTEGTCSDEKSFLVSVNYTPSITNPGAQIVCDSYTLPTITGTHLSGNEKFYNNSQALGGTQITGPITSTQTIWIYDANATCTNEINFSVTVNHTPVITNPGAQSVCDSYSLATITGSNLTGNEKYYNNSHALGGIPILGPITTTQTVWIYDAQGNCSDEESFVVTVNYTPSITNPGDQIVCDSYTLPTILGTNLSGNQKFYTNSQAGGGTVITGPITTTQTVWIYDANATCSDETSFIVTVNHTPSLVNPGAQTVCDTYTLPTITGTNLTGNEKFYNNSKALSGTQITGPITSTQTIWLYDAQGACKDEKSFLVTVNYTPSITNPGSQIVCDSYTLPTILGTQLSGNQKYYNNSQALSGTQTTGPITSTQTVWIYDASGTCSDEESFVVTVNYTPSITQPTDVTACDSYSLLTITGTNLSGNEKYYNNSQSLGGVAIAGSITSSQRVWLFDENGACSNEKSFLVTINYTPNINNNGVQTFCDSYTLPAITGLNLTSNVKYYNNSHALGGTLITGPITSTQTIWVYDADGLCTDEENFIVNINYTPSITNPGNQEACDSYTLPAISGTDLSGNQKYYNNSKALGGTPISGNLTLSQTVWIYDANGTCSDEESFLVTIYHTPVLDNVGDQTVCDSYMLPVITGTNLTGGQKYFTNSQALIGTPISGSITTTQTIWMYDKDGICPAEINFKVTVYHTPSITNPGNQTVCDTYTLPTISGTNLTGGQKYYNNSHALGGTVITGPLTTSQTIWMYDIDGICSNEKSFTVTIDYTPNLINPGPQIVCDSYNLPIVTGTQLSGSQNLYNNSQALGATVISGNITSSQNVWIYDINGACPNEQSFYVTVNHTPIITNPGNVTVCDSYNLPIILGNQLSGNQKYYNNSHALNGAPISGPITLTQTVWIYDEQGSCFDETSFVVTVNHTPNLTNPGDQTVCDTYLLPVISGSNLTGNEKFYNNSQAGGGTPIFGMLTTSQTVWMYDIDGACSNEKSFVLTVNITPTVTFTPDETSGCVPLTVKFTNTSTPLSDEVTWDFGDGNTSTSSLVTNEITHTFTSVNCFDVKLTATSKGCSNSLNLSNLICTYPIPVASFTTDQDRVSILNPVINFNNTSTQATSYNWIFGDGGESVVRDPSHEFPGDKGTYQVILIASTAYGCSDTTSRMIEIYDELIFYIPNTFTPDDDKYNQVFTPIFNAGYDPQNFTMYIFDRWGEIIFETHDSTIGWEGMYGKEEKLKCQDGLYIWKIMYKETKTGNSKTIVGDVILIR